MSSFIGRPKYSMKGMAMVLNCDIVAFAYKGSVEESLTRRHDIKGFGK